MVDVTIDADKVVFKVRGLHKILAFKGKLEIPRVNILSARHDPTVVSVYKGMCVLGTHVPGLVAAGTFNHDGKRIFWDVVRAKRTVVVELANEKYDELIIEVENPDMVVGMLTY